MDFFYGDSMVPSRQQDYALLRTLKEESCSFLVEPPKNTLRMWLLKPQACLVCDPPDVGLGVEGLLGGPLYL